MEKTPLVFLAAVLAMATAFPRGLQQIEDLLPDIYMTTPQLIAYYGYPIEVQEVRTDDGYFLTMHRVPHGIGQEPSTGRPVVFLQHGIFCSSSDWVIMGPGKGLAYILADAGYDVWMGNARGNTYSKKNVGKTEDEYWDFTMTSKVIYHCMGARPPIPRNINSGGNKTKENTWHEMGIHDLPAEIDFVIEQTGQGSMFYIGHSMGTTMFYVMGSMRPEYNSKIRAHFSLGPGGYMDGVRSPIRLIAPFLDVMDWVTHFLGVNEFLPSADLYDFLGAALCKDEAITQSLCSNILFLICGYDSKQLNETMIPVISGHTPAGTSTKAVLHYGQEINSKKFRQYDYGFSKNILIYTWPSPPDYDVSLITAPVYFFYSRNDWLSGEDNVLKLYSQIGNRQGIFIVPYEKFNHVDYLWAIDVKELLYDKIMSLMKSH